MMRAAITGPIRRFIAARECPAAPLAWRMANSGRGWAPSIPSSYEPACCRSVEGGRLGLDRRSEDGLAYTTRAPPEHSRVLRAAFAASGCMGLFLRFLRAPTPPFLSCDVIEKPPKARRDRHGRSGCGAYRVESG